MVPTRNPGESNRCAHSLAHNAGASRRTCWLQCPATAEIVRRRSRFSPTSAGQNPPLDPAHHAAPSSWSELPKTFFKRDVLGHQFGQNFVLGLDLLLQELDPLLLLLDLTDGTFLRLEGGSSVFKELLLPAIEDGGLQSIFLAQIGNRDLV